MKMWKIVLPVTAILLFAGEANADAQPKPTNEAAERGTLSADDANRPQAAERLREAEKRMEAAAREIAEITQQRLPKRMEVERRFEFSNKPRIGIMIDGSDTSGTVDGIEVVGVTPDSAADDAGLRAGDVITAVNGEAMKAESSNAANRLLFDFMTGVEEGDELKVEYLRNGKTRSTELSPRVMEMHAYSWGPGSAGILPPNAPNFDMHPEAMEAFKFRFGFPMLGGAWGNMELVELSEGLGKYFGTNSGLLVVSAPKLDGLELQDGDVIQTIDGRVPKDVRHALRILSSYQSGEKLKLGIMRDKKKRTLDIEVPADLRGSLFVPPTAAPARAPVPPVPPRPPLGDVST